MIDLGLKSCHEVIDTVSVADVDSIFQGKPTDPDILTVLMKDGKRLYCDEVCPIDSLQEEPVSNPIDFEKELYKAFGQVKDFTLGMRIAKWFYDMGKNSQEPTSEVWHDMSESVENGRNIIIIDPTGFYGAVLRKGGSQLKNHNKERYVKWAYIDDLQNLSNVQRTAKNSQEPVSEDLEEAINAYIGYAPEVDECSSVYGKRQAFKAGAKWQKQQDSISSKDLAELIDTLSKRYPEVSFAKLSRIAVRVAKWQKTHLWKP